MQNYFCIFPMRKLHLVFLVFVSCCFAADSLLPVGGDETTSNANLAWDSVAQTYTFSYKLRADIYSYLININSPEIKTGRFKVQATVNSASFTPMQAAAPIYRFSGNHFE